MKKEWTKPELTVLGRGEMEENVLNSCKHDGAMGPQGIHDGQGINGHGTGGSNCYCKQYEGGFCKEHTNS